MTALDQYQRLEAVALWRSSPDEDPREVVVSFGNATLTLMSMEEEPWGHWSLAALEELGSDEHGLVLTPDPDCQETLSLDDRDMISAIRAVRGDAQREIVERRRIKLLAPTLLFLVVLIGAVLLARQPIATFLMQRVDDVTWERVAIALATDRMQADDARFCRVNGSAGLRTSRGHPLLLRIHGRLDPGATAIRPVLARFDGPPVLSLPGALVLLNANAVDLSDQPEQIAGLLALAQARYDLKLDRQVVTQTLGLIGTVRLAASEVLPRARHDDVLEALISAGLRDPQADSAALRLLTAAQLPSLPVSLLLNEYGAPRARIETLQAGDSIGPAVYTPALDDADWLRLKAACD